MKIASAKYPLHPRSSFAPLELACTASNLASLRAAVDNGADNVHLAFRPDNTVNHTELSEFPNLKKGIDYLHARRLKAVVDVLLPVGPEGWRGVCGLISHAERSGIDAVCFSDPAIMLYCMSNHPNLPLYYAAPQDNLDCVAICDLHKRFGINRVILPPVCSLAMIEQLRGQPHLEVEVQVYGRSSEIIGPRYWGKRPAESPPSATGIPTIRLSNSEDRFAVEATSMLSGRCATKDAASNDSNYVIATSHNASALELIPQLVRLGVRAIHIEPIQHDAANLARVTRVWHEAVTACYTSPTQYTVKPRWLELLNKCSKNLDAF